MSDRGGDDMTSQDVSDQRVVVTRRGGPEVPEVVAEALPEPGHGPPGTGGASRHF